MIAHTSTMCSQNPFGADKGIIWGGRERCDPTAPNCQQGGVESGAASAVQPLPATPESFEVTDKVRLSVSIAGEVSQMRNPTALIDCSCAWPPLCPH